MGEHQFSDDLAGLAQQHGSDKWGAHSYTQHYSAHFRSLREEKLNLLEIGIGGYADPNSGGGSLKMWKDYFHKAQIVGLDYYEKSSLEQDRIKTFQGSQSCPRTIAKVLDSVDRNEFDIIIDDGSHRSEHVITSFLMLFQHVSDGGWYVIEDLQTSYWSDFGGNPSPVGTKLTSMSFLKLLIDGLNWAEIHQPGYQPDYTDLHIFGIYFYHNIVFIRKGSNSERSNYVSNNNYRPHIPAM